MLGSWGLAVLAAFAGAQRLETRRNAGIDSFSGLLTPLPQESARLDCPLRRRSPSESFLQAGTQGTAHPGPPGARLLR